MKSYSLIRIATAFLIIPSLNLADDAKKEPLGMTKPVIVTKIYGFASYEPLPDNRLTADDKLTIYYEPTGHTVEKTKDGFHALLSEAAQVRKKGSKDIIWKNPKMFEYEPKNQFPPYRVFLKTDISLKGLPPGEYEIDLTLQDDLKKPPTTIRKTVGFTIYRPEEPKEKAK